jgi:hypothetical protein
MLQPVHLAKMLVNAPSHTVPFKTMSDMLLAHSDEHKSRAALPTGSPQDA